MKFDDELRKITKIKRTYTGVWYNGVGGHILEVYDLYLFRSDPCLIMRNDISTSDTIVANLSHIDTHKTRANDVFLIRDPARLRTGKWWAIAPGDPLSPYALIEPEHFFILTPGMKPTDKFQYPPGPGAILDPFLFMMASMHDTRMVLRENVPTHEWNNWVGWRCFLCDHTVLFRATKPINKCVLSPDNCEYYMVYAPDMR